MIQDSLARIREKITSSCAMVGRNPQEITIVAVSKGRTLAQIREVIGEGISDIGENKVQEASLKAKELKTDGRQLKLHMIGHLQANKAKEAVRIFDLVQSVDSLRIARQIDMQASRIGKIQDVLIEIKTSYEATKSGINPDEAVEALAQMSAFKNVNIKGLMTIAPFFDNPERTRPYFRMLRDLQAKINARSITREALHILSMGMTGDFEVALKEGSTMVRLGRAIFGT